MEFNLINFNGIVFKMPIPDSDDFTSDAILVEELENGYDDNESAAAWCQQQEELSLMEQGHNFGSPQY